MAKKSLDVCQCIPSALLKTWDQGCPPSIASNYNFASFNKEHTHRSRSGGLPLPKPLGENSQVCIHALPISNRSRVLWAEIVNRWSDKQGLTLVQCLCWLHLWCLSDTEKVVSHEWGLHQPDKHIRYIRQIYCTLNDLNVFFLWFQLKSL